MDAEAFNHEAHVYVGWLYLEKYPLAEAIQKFTTALKRLTVKLGVPGKYHDTITWFFMLAIAERRTVCETGDWLVFCASNDDLCDSGQLLCRYYSKTVLASDKARKSFVLPDLIAA